MAKKSKKSTEADEPKPKEEKEQQSRASKAGITLSISRTDKRLRKSGIAKRTGGDAAVYATALVEHILMTVMRGAGEEATVGTGQEDTEKRGKRITANNVVSSVQTNPDLARFFASFVFPAATEIPKAVHHVLSNNEQETRQKKIEERKAAPPKAAKAVDPTE